VISIKNVKFSKNIFNNQIYRHIQYLWVKKVFYFENILNQYSLVSFDFITIVRFVKMVIFVKKMKYVSNAKQKDSKEI